MRTGFNERVLVLETKPGDFGGIQSGQEVEMEGVWLSRGAGGWRAVSGFTSAQSSYTFVSTKIKAKKGGTKMAATAATVDTVQVAGEAPQPAARLSLCCADDMQQKGAATLMCVEPVLYADQLHPAAPHPSRPALQLTGRLGSRTAAAWWRRPPPPPPPSPSRLSPTRSSPAPSPPSSSHVSFSISISRSTLCQQALLANPLILPVPSSLPTPAPTQPPPPAPAVAGVNPDGTACTGTSLPKWDSAAVRRMVFQELSGANISVGTTFNKCSFKRSVLNITNSM